MPVEIPLENESIPVSVLLVKEFKFGTWGTMDKTSFEIRIPGIKWKSNYDFRWTNKLWEILKLYKGLTEKNAGACRT